MHIHRWNSALHACTINLSWSAPTIAHLSDALRWFTACKREEKGARGQRGIRMAKWMDYFWWLKTGSIPAWGMLMTVRGEKVNLTCPFITLSPCLADMIPKFGLSFYQSIKKAVYLFRNETSPYSQWTSRINCYCTSNLSKSVTFCHLIFRTVWVPVWSAFMAR